MKRQKGKRGFALISVLVIMLILTFMSAIIMDLTLNAHSTSMEMIQDKKLYNAAQSGIKYGVSLLRSNIDGLASGTIDITGSVSTKDNVLPQLRPAITNGSGQSLPWTITSFAPAVSAVEVDVLDCDYSTGGTDYYSFLPPVRAAGSAGGGGGSSGGLSQIGTSGYLDPNRNITFLSGSGTSRFFVVRSTATSVGGRTLSIETMVVITQ
ncbi:MAG: hypothetical protein Q7I97_05910 [Thermovirgaceae bacterium]|nr:hypothetical protein [Thermovirgaceae bacterium]